MEQQARLIRPLQDWIGNIYPSAHLLLVGGAVRDFIRGQPDKDLDVEILGLPLESMEDLPWPSKSVGRSFSHWIVELPEAGWVEVSVDPTPVSDGLEATWNQLCRRRDFRCNAMAWEPEQGCLLDPLGGAQDIAQGCLRLADPESLSADPLRVWRAAQFCARFSWTVDRELHSRIADVVPVLPGLAPERVTREWEKLLTLSHQPSMGLSCLEEWGVLDRCCPGLSALRGCPQDPLYHPEGDVWTHVLLVSDEAARLAHRESLESEARLVLQLAALLHDIGKPLTTREEGTRVTAHGHEAAGLGPAREWFQNYRFSEQVMLSVLDCVAHHMRPLALTRQIESSQLSARQQANALRKLRRDLQAVSWDVFLLFCEADRRGRATAVTEFAPTRVLGEILTRLPEEAVAPVGLLKGRDLVGLGIPPGPVMGEWLRRVEEARDRGLVVSVEEALDWVRAQLNPSA